MKRFISLLLGGLMLFVVLVSPVILQSCSDNEPFSVGDGSVNVLCTTFAPFDIARQIGKDNVTVSILQDSGSDLHSYTPTVATLDALSKADIFICIGGVSDESWLERTLAAAGNDDLVVIELINYVTPIYAELENDWAEHDGHNHENDEHNHGEVGHNGHVHACDEHIWTSVKNAALMADVICNALCSFNEENFLKYQENKQHFVNELNKLDREIENIADSLVSRTLIFADRFPFVYLMHDYHIAYKAAFSGCTTEVNSNFEMQISLIKTVKESGENAIITIEGGDKNLAKAVSDETGCKIFSLDSMQYISRKDIVNGANYLDIMKKNIEVLKEVSHVSD